MTSLTRFLLLHLILVCSLVFCYEPLKTYNINKDTISVSGISSGASFATQFHIAFSSVVQGLGSWAGAPYLCYSKYSFLCLKAPSIIDVASLVNETVTLADLLEIDSTANLANDRVYLVHGTKDETYFPESSKKLQLFYQTFINNSENIILKNDIAASHAVISDHFGTPCGIKNEYTFIEDCDFNSVFYMLNHLLGGDLQTPSSPGNFQGELIQFDQDEFFDGNAQESSMDSSGFVYVPPSCHNGAIQCSLHVFFHGCSMQAETIGTDFITEAGFLEVADTNDLIILFPQNVGVLSLGNPIGCFNWLGYLHDLSNLDYAKKSASQMSGIYNIIVRAAGL